MENWAFKKVEMWAVGLIALVLILFAFGFGVVVRNVALGYERFGIAGKLAYSIASVPSYARKYVDTVQNGSRLLAEEGGGRFGTRSGWEFAANDPGAIPDGYLLLSRYDGNQSRHTVELYDLNSREVTYSWPVDADILLKDAQRTSQLVNFDRWNTQNFRAIHPLALESGDLIIKEHGAPLMRTTPCGDLVWRIDSSLFHHTTELDSDGNLWVTNHFEPAFDPELAAGFKDDGIVKVSPDGEILFERSFTEVLVEQGQAHFIFGRGRFQMDPLHLNDVQPVLSDGPFWKKGDVFLSLRHLSMIVLYRPATDEIIWMKEGPWMQQHDVDVIDQDTIAVYDNNHFNIGDRHFVNGVNSVIFYDFDTDETRQPYQRLFEKHDIRTVSEGLFSLLPSGHLLVEEENSGRFLIFGPDGTLGAEFINRAEDGEIYMMGWSRYIDREKGDAILKNLQTADCTASTG